MRPCSILSEFHERCMVKDGVALVNELHVAE